MAPPTTASHVLPIIDFLMSTWTHCNMEGLTVNSEALMRCVCTTGACLPVSPLCHPLTQVSVFGQRLTLTLVARRSRHFAGTRFRKRGISHQVGRRGQEVFTV